MKIIERQETSKNNKIISKLPKKDSNYNSCVIIYNNYPFSKRQNIRGAERNTSVPGNLVPNRYFEYQ